MTFWPFNIWIFQIWSWKKLLMYRSFLKFCTALIYNKYFFLACFGGSCHDKICTKSFPEVVHHISWYIRWLEATIFCNPGRIFYLSKIFFFFFCNISGCIMHDLIVASSDFTSKRQRNHVTMISLQVSLFCTIRELSDFYWYFTAAHHDFSWRENSSLKIISIHYFENFFQRDVFDGTLYSKMM